MIFVPGIAVLHSCMLESVNLKERMGAVTEQLESHVLLQTITEEGILIFH